MRLKPAYSFSGFAGINNVADPGRMPTSGGKLPLREAVNIDIDDTLMASRAKGYALVYPGNVHSAWANRKKEFGLCVEAGTLKRITWDGALLTLAILLTGLDPGARMNYAETDERVFMTNGSFIGYLEGEAVHTLSAPDQTFKTRMPAGHLIEFYANQVYVAVDRVIFFSDSVAWGRTDPRKNFIPFLGRLRMMQAVEDGIFVSDENGTYFLSGKTGLEMVLINKSSQPVFPGGYQKLDGSVVGSESTPISGDVVFMVTSEGICLGGPGGSFSNLTRDRYHPAPMSEISSLVLVNPTTHQIVFIGSICTPVNSGEIEMRVPTLTVNFEGHS